MKSTAAGEGKCTPNKWWVDSTMRFAMHQSFLPEHFCQMKGSSRAAGMAQCQYDMIVQKTDTLQATGHHILQSWSYTRTHEQNTPVSAERSQNRACAGARTWAAARF